MLKLPKEDSKNYHAVVMEKERRKQISVILYRKLIPEEKTNLMAIKLVSLTSD